MTRTESPLICKRRRPARALASSAAGEPDRRLVTSRSPPVSAPATMKVPASMRSGMMRWRRHAASTPCTRMVWVPAPSICAPILLSKRRQIGDFGLARAILQNGFAFGQRGGHQQVFGAGNGNLVEDDAGALEPLGAGFDVAVLLRDRAPSFSSPLR